MESVDIVDEHDQPTGRTLPRKEACDGPQKIWHRCVALFVFDKQGRLFVQTHKKIGLLDHSVGGHVDAGEDYATAVRREAEEELGIVNVPFHELGTSIPSVGRHHNHMFGIYECFPGDDWVFTPNDEVSIITPMTLEEVVRQMHEAPEHFTSGFINTLKFFLHYKHSPLKILVDPVTKHPVV